MAGDKEQVGQMINVVIPIAGEGSRFARVGYKLPKPFIDVEGEPMVSRVLENIALKDAKYLLVCRPEHLGEAYESHRRRIQSKFDCTFLPVDKPTEGAACTILHARKFIDNDSPLLLANSDQVVDIDIAKFCADCTGRGLDGSIMTFRDPSLNPKWSYAKAGADGIVTEVREKQAISDQATVGIYYFRRGSDFVDGALDMIIRNDRTNNEFYTCPVYNYVIREGRRVGIFEIPANAMHGLGTPEDLEIYLGARGSSPRKE